MWFEYLTGFKEESPERVRENLLIEGNTFVSKANSKSFSFGELEIPTLSQLKEKCGPLENYKSAIKVSELVADVQDLHCNPSNENALFQAASQFNLLEMISPGVSPELGIDRYEFDHTQGPACAIACGAGTIYRNYFVNVNGKIGQSENNQIDCLDLIGKELGNQELNLWAMKNGYALLHQEGLLTINRILSENSDSYREMIKGQLKTGIQWNTEVTLSITKHKVSQIYCSALPVAYSQVESYYWENFARLILEATYEATLYAAVYNLERYNSNKVFMTLVGGGAFGNDEHWILESLQSSIRKFKNVPLDIKIVSYGKSNSNLIECINEI